MDSEAHIEKYKETVKAAASVVMELLKKNHPDASLPDMALFCAMLATLLTSNSFVEIVKSSGFKRAEDWFMSYLADFAESVKSHCAEDGMNVNIEVTSIFKDDTQSEGDRWN